MPLTPTGGGGPYRALTTDAAEARVCFRLCPAMSVSVDYDLATTYRRSPVPNPSGQPIPVLGVQGGSVVSVPFFAEPRQDASAVSMEIQTDPANVQTLVHDGTGKVEALRFDGYGNFEGFVLETEDGDRRFSSRERAVERLAERAWRQRLRITVYAERDEPRRPIEIRLDRPPAGIDI